MPYYKWSGVDLYGNDREGKLFARSVQDLDQMLFKREIALLKNKVMYPFAWRNPSTSIQVQFFKQASLLLRSGMHVPEVLAVAVQYQQESVKFQESLNAIADQIRQGSSIKDAFGEYPALFDSITLTMLQVGQESGALSPAMAAVAARLHMNDQFYKKLRSAALLPFITLCFFFMAASFIFVFIIPTFTALLKTNNQELPWITRTLLNISNLMRSYTMLLVIVGLGFFGYVIGKCLGKSSVKPAVDKLLLKLPFVRSFILLTAQGAFLESLSLLLGQGMHMVPALTIAMQVVNNEGLHISMAQLRQEVTHGASLSQAMRLCSQQLFSCQTIAMAAVGEESGAISSMLGQAAVLQQEKVLRKIGIVTTFVQPVLMLMLGLLVAALIFALYIPLFNIPQAF